MQDPCSSAGLAQSWPDAAAKEHQGSCHLRTQHLHAARLAGAADAAGDASGSPAALRSSAEDLVTPLLKRGTCPTGLKSDRDSTSPSLVGAKTSIAPGPASAS